MNEKYTHQIIRMLPIEGLQMGGYQRPTNQAQVEDIAAVFDEAKLGVPIVSLRDGKYRLLDGAHRVAALRKLGYTHTLFIVLTGLTYQDECDFFRTQDRNSSALTKYNQFISGLEAQDPLYVAIDEICRANGFTVGMAVQDFNTISAIFALTTICTVYGYNTLNTTLALIRSTWDGVNTVTRREFLIGVAEFVHRFGTVRFAERMKHKSIAAIWEDYLAEASFSARQGYTPAIRRAFCRALVQQYNIGLAAKNRLVMEV